MLALEIEFLTGTVVATSNRDEAVFDWPPQPDRVFSALVAAWGARGRREEERKALEWLEKQHPPQIVASESSSRNALTRFVPPNDFKTSANGRFDVLPSRRERQPRYFPTGTPHERIVKHVWAVQPDAGTVAALDALARDTAYVGHSASLTRCRFVDENSGLVASEAPKRMVYEGRLAELERLFQAGRRPTPGEPTLAVRRNTDMTKRGNIFSREWIVFAGIRGDVPDLRAAPIVAKKMRATLMDGYTRAYGSAAPEWLSGHSAPEERSYRPHAAFVPMANLGWERSTGDLMGFALVLPSGVSVDELIEPIRTLINIDAAGEPQIEVGYAPGAKWFVSPEPSDKKSLSVNRWTKPARIWASATPIALDRYPKKRAAADRDREIADSIAAACVNIGLPRPSWVLPHAGSAITASPGARSLPGAPPWQRWQLPSSLRGRYLTHAILGFDEPVAGPVLVGAGRYVGLGLCMPHDQEANNA